MALTSFSKPAFRITMSRKFLFGAALAALLLFGVSASADRISATSRWAQQNTQASEVTGKVIGIGQDKKSISLEVTDQSNPSTMQFAVDENTRITGRVSVGNTATVQYQSTNDGKLVALNISPKTPTQ